MEVKNTTSLIAVLSDTFNQLNSGSLGLEQAREICRMSGKIISASKVQFEYNKHMNSEKKIDFLEQPE